MSQPQDPTKPEKPWASLRADQDPSKAPAPPWPRPPAEQDASPSTHPPQPPDADPGGERLLASVRRAQREDDRASRQKGWALAARIQEAAHERRGEKDPAAAHALLHAVPPPPPLASWEGAEDDDDDASGAPHLVSMRNYAAVDATHGQFGLIDRGLHEKGVQGLVMHTPAQKRKRAGGGRHGHPETIRPGDILTLRATASGAMGRVRVRFTTPARYYAPGQKVTTLSVGVDEGDWRRLLLLPQDAPHPPPPEEETGAAADGGGGGRHQPRRRV